MGKCVIVGAGDFDEASIDYGKEDFIIAADGGLKSLQKLGITPDLVIGDMDSYDGLKSIEAYEHNIEVIRLPAEKDDTDTLAAIRVGLKKGYTEFEIYGALGGRLDHTIANLQCLDFLISEGARGKIKDKGVEIYLACNEKLCFGSHEQGRISCFAFGGTAFGVTEKGLKYEVENFELNTNFPIGVSNEFIGKEGFISVESGKVIIYKERA